MSRFNHYAKKLEELTFEAAKKLKEAEAKEESTRQSLSAFPERNGFVDANYQLERSKRIVAHDEAVLNLRKVKETVPKELSRQLAEMRSKLKAEADDYFAVDPSQLQPEVVSFLKSDMLNLNDYNKLMKAAIADNNVTMIRIIADSANKSADNTTDNDTRLKLKAIATEADIYTSDNYLTAFDSLVSVSESCMNNIRLVDHWNTDLGINQVVEGF